MSAFDPKRKWGARASIFTLKPSARGQKSVRRRYSIGLVYGALMREPRQPICIALSERVPSRSFGELQVADVGSESQADP
jgi:hypothetical protein